MTEIVRHGDKEGSGKRLTPNKRAAIVLEANGYKRPEIARALGVKSGTIKGWHDDYDYMRELEKASKDVDTALEPVLEVLRVRLGTSMLRAQEVLEEALDARTKDGLPYWSVRMAAVRTLLDSYKIVAPKDEKDDDGPAIGTLIMNVDRETAAQMLEAQKRQNEAIDVEVVDEE